MSKLEETYRIVQEDLGGGCSDGGCHVKRPVGMHTNGGCHCLHNRDKHLTRRVLQRLLYALREEFGDG